MASVDGSTHFVFESVDPVLWNAPGSRDSDETLGDPY